MNLDIPISNSYKDSVSNMSWDDENVLLPPISPTAKNLNISQILEYEKSRNLLSKGKMLS